MKDDRQFVTALARGIEVLRCFTAERPELGTTEIAAMTGLPQPTVWRLCHTLLKLGYLQTVRNGEKLRVGLSVLSLGYAAMTQRDFRVSALPLMREVADEFDASVSLAVRNQLAMVIVQRAEAQRVLRLNLHVGSELAIERSALGCAYLARIDAAERERLIAACSARVYPDAAIALRRFVEDAVRQYERTGYVLNLRHYHPNVNAIGVPVVSSDGRTVMALNCGGADTVVTQEILTGPLAGRLQEIAAQIGAMLPATGPARADTD